MISVIVQPVISRVNANRCTAAVWSSNVIIGGEHDLPFCHRF